VDLIIFLAVLINNGAFAVRVSIKTALALFYIAKRARNSQSYDLCCFVWFENQESSERGYKKVLAFLQNERIKIKTPRNAKNNLPA
jgi:hypothetical protein